MKRLVLTLSIIHYPGKDNGGSPRGDSRMPLPVLTGKLFRLPASVAPSGAPDSLFHLDSFQLTLRNMPPFAAGRAQDLALHHFLAEAAEKLFLAFTRT